MAYRDDVFALAARHAALDAEVADTTRKLAAARAELARARLPVLDNVRVASPCRADWNAMVGDARVRACGSCNKHVYNLSGMTRAEAEALIVAREGQLCVRYYQRADGTILLADCTIRAKRRWITAAAIVAAAGTAVGVYHERTHRSEAVMGAIVIPEQSAAK